MRAGLPPLRGLLPLILLLLVWQLLQSGPSPYFPAPSQWWTATVALINREHLLAGLRRDDLDLPARGWRWRSRSGPRSACSIGVSDRAARALHPLLEFMRAIPPPVTVPVAALLIGYNESMKLTVVVLSALWPILFNATLGGAADRPAAARRRPLVPHERRPSGCAAIVLPAIVPSLLIGIRVAIPLAIVVTLLVEMLTSLPGIGALMIRSQRNFQSGEVYALLVLVGLFGFVVNDLFAVVEGMILRRWPPRG